MVVQAIGIVHFFSLTLQSVPNPCCQQVSEYGQSGTPITFRFLGLKDQSLCITFTGKHIHLSWDIGGAQFCSHARIFNGSCCACCVWSQFSHLFAYKNPLNLTIAESSLFEPTRLQHLIFFNRLNLFLYILHNHFTCRTIPYLQPITKLTSQCEIRTLWTELTTNNTGLSFDMSTECIDRSMHKKTPPHIKHPSKPIISDRDPTIYWQEICSVPIGP